MRFLPTFARASLSRRRVSPAGVAHCISSRVEHEMVNIKRVVSITLVAGALSVTLACSSQPQACRPLSAPEVRTKLINIATVAVQRKDVPQAQRGCCFVDGAAVEDGKVVLPAEVRAHVKIERAPSSYAMVEISTGPCLKGYDYGWHEITKRQFDFPTLLGSVEI